MTDDDNLRAHIDPVHLDTPPVMSEPRYDLISPELPDSGTPVLVPVASGVHDYLLALARIDDGYTEAPGDHEGLPPAVREVVDRTAADEGRGAGDYWVKYRPALDPFGAGDVGYETMVIPARIMLGAGTAEVTLDLDADAFIAGIERARVQFAKLGEAMATVAEAAGEAFRPVAEALRRAFGPIVYLTDGPAPAAPTDAESALAWLAYAETVAILQRPPKALRRRAKRRYLEVKRHLGREHRARLARVPMARFGAI